MVPRTYEFILPNDPCMRQGSYNMNDNAKPIPNPKPTKANKRIAPSLSCQKLSGFGEIEL